ncbi:MAG: class I SAM-dependent methyltransferase [Deltaproteobacteria bacterium]|nr:class I SAM-dependent methyltransferase [Nannocystaceae bacterium]
MTSGGNRLKHYGTFGLGQIATQLLNVRRQRARVPGLVDVKHERLRRDEARIAGALGDAPDGTLRGRRVLIVGPGQLLREARYYAVHNQVTCLDIDVIPKGVDLEAYAHMLRNNGLGRVIKTVGRKLVGNDRYELSLWRDRLGVARLPDPRCVVGDISDGAPEPGSWDVLTSVSVFQSIPDARLAVQRCAEALRPGGVLYIGVHIWTCNSGHHDIRAFTGRDDEVPLWAHLRPSQAHLVQRSAYLNELRLRDWRAIFGEMCPGFHEFQERYDEAEFRAKMTPELRRELADYEDDELYSVDVFFCWRKP